jgi:hypothetical protein
MAIGDQVVREGEGWGLEQQLAIALSLATCSHCSTQLCTQAHANDEGQSGPLATVLFFRNLHSGLS